MKKLLKILIIFAIVIFCLALAAFLVMYFLTPAELKDETTLGLKVRSQTWSGEITVKGSVYFAPWATLTIKPGTKILFDKKPDIPNTDWSKWADAYVKDHNDPTGRVGYGQSHYTLYGKIMAIGTKESPVIFTSAQAKQEYADWDQVVLKGKSRIEYAELSYSHNGFNLEGNNITIKNSKIHDSLWSGVDIYSWSNSIEDSEIYHCWHQAVSFKARAGSLHINVLQNTSVHDAWLGINCEGTAIPWITQNTFAAAPVADNCQTTPPVPQSNTITEKSYDTPGGTYAGQLIYPSASN